jgi:hypothetical protein
MGKLRAVLIVDWETNQEWLQCVCLFCETEFQASQSKVPTWRDKDGDSQPFCYECLKQVNERKIIRGLPPFKIHPNAYDKEPINNLY